MNIVDTSKFDTAQICINSHIITLHYDYSPQERKNFCPQCGAPTIIECPHCHNRIKGIRYETGNKFVSGNMLTGETHYREVRYEVEGNAKNIIPSYCEHCGKPFPWTQQLLDSSSMIFDTMDNISDSDKDKLKEIFPNLISNTAATIPAALQFNVILNKTSDLAVSAIKALAENCIVEAARQFIHW